MAMNLCDIAVCYRIVTEDAFGLRVIAAPSGLYRRTQRAALCVKAHDLAFRSIGKDDDRPDGQRRALTPALLNLRLGLDVHIRHGGGQIDGHDLSEAVFLQMGSGGGFVAPVTQEI
jgi:hypothetical protein